MGWARCGVFVDGPATGRIAAYPAGESKSRRDAGGARAGPAGGGRSLD